MAAITASVYTSHVPAIGAALDLGKSGERYWQKVFAGYEFSKRWLKDNTPDVIFLVYNDHANAFSFDLIPTFAIGCAPEFAIADEGWGPRPGGAAGATAGGAGGGSAGTNAGGAGGEAPGGSGGSGGAPNTAVCGNGTVEPGEECDDGNTSNNDWCNNSAS